MSVRALWRRAARALGGGRGLDRRAPRPARSAVLEYGCRRFVKSYRAHVALEFARGEAIHRAAAASGAFRAPAPLAVLEEHDLIVWECLDGLVELREHLMQDVARRPDARADRARLFDAAGRALAAIHASLRALGAEGEHRPFAAVRTGDAALDAHVARCLDASPLCPLHWDFVCGNLFVVDGALVVLDATPNWYLFPPGDTRVASPVYVDGGTLAFSLCGHPRFSPAVAAEADGVPAGVRGGVPRGRRCRARPPDASRLRRRGDADVPGLRRLAAGRAARTPRPPGASAWRPRHGWPRRPLRALRGSPA